MKGQKISTEAHDVTYIEREGNRMTEHELRNSERKTLQNDLQICISSLDRQKHGGIGISDDAVASACERALAYVKNNTPVVQSYWEDGAAAPTGTIIYGVCHACRKTSAIGKFCSKCGATMTVRQK